MSRITSVIMFVILIGALGGSIYLGVSNNESQNNKIADLEVRLKTKGIDYDKKIKQIDGLLDKIEGLSTRLKASEDSQLELVEVIKAIKYKTVAEVKAKFAAEKLEMKAKIAKLEKEKPKEAPFKALEMKFSLCLEEVTDLQLNLTLCNDKVEKYGALAKEFDKYKTILGTGKLDYDNLVVVAKDLYKNVRTERDILAKQNVSLAIDLDKVTKKKRLWKSIGLGAVVGGLILVFASR